MIQSGMQFDGSNRWYGNVIDFFDSLYSAGKGSRKIGQETKKIPMRGNLRSEVATPRRNPPIYAKLFFVNCVIDDKNMSSFDRSERLPPNPCLFARLCIVMWLLRGAKRRGKLKVRNTEIASFVSTHVFSQ